MRMYYDMSFKEIAAFRDISINTALGRMRYAVFNLKKMIEEKNLSLSLR
jgi:RNA polymerase sigma-70 factor (ECF subfamily)